MNRSILAAIRCSLLLLVPTATYAISAQWDLDPISGDWNAAANWTPDEVPNGPADIATFGLSNTTNISISENTEVNGITFTSAATNPYIITASPGLTLTISGAGITNNSGITQKFVTAVDSGGNRGQLNFTNSSTAGNVSIENFGSTSFLGSSTAANATIHTANGFVTFFDNSTAGSAFIECNGNSFLDFVSSSSAGNAFLVLSHTDSISFEQFSTAGNAIINSAGSISFSGSSQGGTAQIELLFLPGNFFLSVLDISSHNAPGVTIGSLAGNNENTVVYLGANNLTVGSNNLSTTFSGIIRDSGGIGGGTGGSLTKIGSGTLILSEANTYTGNTNVDRGVLQLDGSITSNTFVNHRGTLAGTGTIHGNVTNGGTVSPGHPVGTLTVSNYTQAQYADLMIQMAGANVGQFSVLNVIGTANLSGHLDPVLLNGFIPTIGESFTFLQAGLVTGTLFIFNRNIDDEPLHWEVSYFPTYATLTVTAGNVPLPDQGSTFLLLTLGLLGLVTYRRQLLRGQA
jgi:autotransporter-associated beta strand protein